MMGKRVAQEDWNRLLDEGLDYSDSDFNVRFDFVKMSKKFGRAFVEYIRAAYQAKDTMTDAEFCRVNRTQQDVLRRLVA